MVTGQIISQEADCGGCCFTSSSPHLPIFQPPLPSFSSLGAWQHPSRWRVYFCFCLFTYSCIQLFRASQGLSFHHRMQIATAANPLSSLPCRHPTSLSVSPSLLESGHVCFFGQYRISRAVTRPASPPLLPYTPYMSNPMERLPPTPPNPGATRGQEWSSSYSAIPLQMEACRSVLNWVSKDKSGFGHQLVRLKQFRWIRRLIHFFY